MIQFEVKVMNKPGTLSLVCEHLTKAGVNIISVSTESNGKNGILKIITNNELATKSVLKEAGLEFQEREIVAVELLDNPGELGRFAKALSEHDVNIQSVFLLDRNGGNVRLAVKTDHLENTIKAIQRLQRKFE